MTNELKIINEQEVYKLKEMMNDKDDFFGHVYIIEYGDGCIKIGSTFNLYQRISTLISNNKNYGNQKTGRIAYTLKHTNYIENEKSMHNIFKKLRKGRSEIFKETIENAMFELSKLEFKDDSFKKNEDANLFAERMELLLLKNKNITNTYNINNNILYNEIEYIVKNKEYHKINEFLEKNKIREDIGVNLVELFECLLLEMLGSQIIIESRNNQIKIVEMLKEDYHNDK